VETGKGNLGDPASEKIFLAGTRRAILSGHDSSILPARVANQSSGFDSSCPLAQPAISANSK